ncbi:uncharacterized protein TNCV_4101481 [Trichonephila clavipes]|nr:uncharacterized protein TNCV_4101481 [Trichonephila clavipes]
MGCGLKFFHCRPSTFPARMLVSLYSAAPYRRIPIAAVGFDLKLEEINFHGELLSRVVKHSEIPDLIRQLALKTINCISRTSLQIYTDGSRVPSHVGIDFNEKADFLPRTAAEEEVSPSGYLTFSELSSLKKIELHHFGRTPPSHPWYFRRNPGGSSKLMPRKYQIAFSHFVSGNRKSLSFRQGQKIFPECHLCYSKIVSPAHILTCLNFKKDEVLLEPLLFLDFLDVNGFMEIV